MGENTRQLTGQCSQLTNRNWDSITGSLHQPNVGNESLRLCCANGANIVLCTEDGFKVTMHETLVRRFTNIFNFLGDTTEMDELRDPYGLIVFVLQGVEGQTLKRLSEFLYTGVCWFNQKDTTNNILSLLNNNCKPDMQLLKQEDDTFDLRMLDENEGDREEREEKSTTGSMVDDTESEEEETEKTRQETKDEKRRKRGVGEEGGQTRTKLARRIRTKRNVEKGGNRISFPKSWHSGQWAYCGRTRL